MGEMGEMGDGKWDNGKPLNCASEKTRLFNNGL